MAFSDDSMGAVIIGGIAVGTAGTGIYAGRIMQGGDDFNGSLSVQTPMTPSGTYGTTADYSAGSRSKGGALAATMDTDPYFTGESDSNNGVPFISDTMVQTNSIVTLKARIAQSGELPYLNGRTYVSAMLHLNGSMVLCAPYIFETYTKYNILNANLPGGNHNTEWTMQTNPITQATGNKVEIDWIEGGNGNLNIHGAGAGTTNISSGGTAAYDNNWHLITQVADASGIVLYLDGVSKGTNAQDCTANSAPYAIYLTNHITTPTLADWQALGMAGFTASHDYWRAWASNYVKKLQNLPDVYVDYGSSVSYTFPAVTALYANATALGITDYIQAMRVENFEPGAASPSTGEYNQIPSWGMLTGRVLTGTPDYPGTLNLVSQPFLASSLAEVARGHIYVGPHIITSQLNATVGTPYTYNLYQDCQCGTLFANKQIAVTGLPSGATYNASTFTISWPSPTTSSTSISITVTNAVGQTATANRTLAAASGALAIDTAASSTNFNSGTLVTTATLSTSAAGELLVLFQKSNTSIPANGITAVTDTALLSWTLAGTISNSVSRIECWYAYASSQVTGDIVTVVSGVGTTSAAINLFSIANPNATVYLDTNGSNPASAFSSTGVTSLTTTLSTSHANDMIVSCVATGVSETYTLPTGFTEIGGGFSSAFRDSSYLITSGTLSSSAIKYQWGSNGTALMLTVAFQGL